MKSLLAIIVAAFATVAVAQTAPAAKKEEAKPAAAPAAAPAAKKDEKKAEAKK